MGAKLPMGAKLRLVTCRLKPLRQTVCSTAFRWNAKHGPFATPEALQRIVADKINKLFARSAMETIPICYAALPSCRTKLDDVAAVTWATAESLIDFSLGAASGWPFAPVEGSVWRTG